MIRLFTTTFALTCLLSGPLAADPATFATPQDAVEAFIASLSSQDKDAVLTVFGAESEDFLSTGDPVEDRLNAHTILAMYSEGFRMVPQENGSLVLALGEGGWPFPVPIARDGDAWTFDIVAGRQEVKDREIGLNELEVLDLMDAYVDVQAAYRLVDHDGDGVMEFARQIISSSETARDGLFWPGADSPLGELLARASATGYSDGETDHDPIPYAGYFFRILTEQTDAAPGGAMNYLVNDNMVGGHALLAVPADYGVTGVTSFMVSENGIILEAVLGDDTLDVAAAMAAYDPTADWTHAE
jgi:hypothetical protein